MTTKTFQDRFNFIRDILVIVGIFFAGGSMIYAGQTVRDNARVNSAQFVLTVSHNLDDSRYADIITAVEGDSEPHPISFPILKSSRGKFSPGDVDAYIGNYDQIANLWQDGLIDERMAYDEFSYEIEKTWCNNDIQNYIMSERRADKHLVGYVAFYDAFENIAKRFLKIDGVRDCKELDNT